MGQAVVVSSRFTQQITEINRMAASSSAHGIQVKFEYGELSAYDPTTYEGKFILPMAVDENDVAQETGWVPIGSMFCGSGYGAQFTPPTGAQALLIFLGHDGFAPVSGVFLYTDIEKPAFPDGKSNGWKDKTGNQVKTTDDGQNAGDGAGGARIVGSSYSSVVAPKIELGIEGLSVDQDVVRRKDLQHVVDQVNMFVQTFNAHLHAGVSSGMSVTLAPTKPASIFDPAKASTTVAAND